MKFVGNCADVINWYDVIDSLQGNPGESIGKTSQVFDANGDPVDKRPFHYEQALLIKQAGYNKSDTIEWINYYVEKDFSKEVEIQFAKFLDVDPGCAWISSIRPGKCIPYHWDFDYGKWDEDIVKNKHKAIRYTCHIGDPKFGHVFATDDHCFYNQQNGNIYRWNNLNLYHGGSNFGIEQKYLFNFIGYTK